MTKSRLPLEQRIFVPLGRPEVIVLGPGEVLSGPFCVNCGNPQSMHRHRDDACPVRRLHAMLPQGERERCNCRLQNHPKAHARHDPECNRIRYGFNGTVVR